MTHDHDTVHDPREAMRFSGELTTIALRSFHGMYASAHRKDFRISSSERRGIFEEFEVHVCADGKKIALKTAQGRFLSVEKKSENLMGNEDEIEQHGKFEVIVLDENDVAVRTYHDKFVCAEQSGSIVCNSVHRKNWEMFQVEIVNRGTRPIAAFLWRIFGGNNKHINIRTSTWNGSLYMSASSDGNSLTTSKEAGKQELFSLKEADVGKVAIRNAATGRYIQVNLGQVVLERRDAFLNAQFSLIPRRDGSYVIRGCNGNYLTYNADNGKFTCSDDELNASTMFRIDYVW